MSCQGQHGTNLYEYDENCSRCMVKLGAIRPWSEEEAMENGYPYKPMGNDDRQA